MSAQQKRKSGADYFATSKNAKLGGVLNKNKVNCGGQRLVSPRGLAIALYPAPRPPGPDDGGMCGITAAGCVGLVVGRPGLPARGLVVASGCNAAAAGGVGTWGRAEPRQHGPLRGGAVDSLVEGADRKGRTTTGAGARSNHAGVVG